MNIGIVGGRLRHDFDYIEKQLDMFVRPKDIIISGGAAGVDSYAHTYAVDHKLSYLVKHPIERTAEAFKARNIEIVAEADVILAFPAKGSRGTWHTVNAALKQGKRVVVYTEVV